MNISVEAIFVNDVTGQETSIRDEIGGPECTFISYILHEYLGNNLYIPRQGDIFTIVNLKMSDDIKKKIYNINVPNPQYAIYEDRMPSTHIKFRIIDN